MAKIKINKNECKGCQLCILYCPKKILVQDKELNIRGVFSAVVKDKSKECTSCQSCVLICPENGIIVYK